MSSEIKVNFSMIPTIPPWFMETWKPWLMIQLYADDWLFTQTQLSSSFLLLWGDPAAKTFFIS